MGYADQVFDVQGKVVIVTGASSGIGKHFAKVLAKCGCKVVCSARRKTSLDSLVKEITDAGGVALAVSLDVTKLESIKNVCKVTYDTYGSIDVLVNNAGVSKDDAPAIEHTEEDWDWVINTNLKGPWFLAQETARYMMKQGTGGSIINIASILGFRVDNYLTEYTTSKAGLLHLTRQNALEWARHKIRVNALCPGYFMTEINEEIFKDIPGKEDRRKVGLALTKRIPFRRVCKVVVVAREHTWCPSCLTHTPHIHTLGWTIERIGGGPSTPGF